jgi:hypothetical protein
MAASPVNNEVLPGEDDATHQHASKLSTPSSLSSYSATNKLTVTSPQQSAVSDYDIMLTSEFALEKKLIQRKKQKKTKKIKKKKMNSEGRFETMCSFWSKQLRPKHDWMVRAD